MSKKLTLRLSEDVIERAKKYAKARGTSVSQLVEQYFVALTDEEQGPRHRSGTSVSDRASTFSAEASSDEAWRDRLSPVVQSLLGSLHGANIDGEDYYRYLEQKHL